MNNVQNFMKTMDANISYKTAILPLLPKGRVNILDFGGGTGVLSHAIKKSNSEAHITLLDSNNLMLETARSNNTADLYVDNFNKLPYNSYDVIIFCSVLHEVPKWQTLIRDIDSKLKPGGSIIIRDGVKSYSKSTLKRTVLKLRNPDEAKEFFEACDPNSVIAGLDIKFIDDFIDGNVDDVRSFLQTYTWGLDSLEREQYENHLFASVVELESFFLNKHSFNYDSSSLEITKICQQNYFKHMDKLIYLKEMWNTHVILKVNKAKR